MKKFSFFGVLVFLAVMPGGAQPFRLGLKTEISIASALLAGEIFHTVYDYTATEDDWDGVPFNKADVNAFDRKFMHGYDKTLAMAGNVMMGILPAGALLCNAYGVYKNYDFSAVVTETVMAAETFLMAHTLPHTVKPLVLRTRPYNYYAGDEALKDDWNRSFFSGHTTMAFAAATFGSYTYCKWFPNSAMRVPFVAVSYTLAAATGLSRIYAGCHFASDVLVGAAVGTAVGFFVPWLHTLQTKDTQIALLPNGFSVKKNL